jgi:hypothetical protein
LDRLTIEADVLHVNPSSEDAEVSQQLTRSETSIAGLFELGEIMG